MLKKRSLWVGFVVSLILILVNIVPTMAQGQTDDGFLYSSLSLFSPTALTYDRSRFGFQVTYGGGDPNLYDVESLGAGWYWDKEARGASDIPSHDYVQTIRLSPVLSGSTQISYTTTPSGTALIDAIAAQSGSTWFIGHQPDCHTEDNLLSEFYAYAYHDLYHLIKDVDPTAKIAAGNIVQPTEQRLMYLDRVLETYEQTYGEPLPADLWATGNMILCEKCYPYKPPGEPFAWGACWVPDWPSYGASYDIATFYSVYDHWDVDIYASRIITFRQWMHDNGYQNHPLVISEYGILFYEGLVEGQTIQDDIDFMWETFDWMRSVRDPGVGYAADDGLLTQRWAWYSLDHGAYPGGTLFDPETYQPTALGIAYADYTSAISNCARPVTGVSMSGPISGDVGTELLFTADITPSNATTPITYSWSSDGFSHSGGTGMIPTKYASYRWDSPGVKTITVTVRNCGRQDFSYTFSVTIGDAPSGDAYEPNNTCDTAGAIPTDGTVQAHTFHTADDEDWITFDAISGTEYLVEGITPPDSVADLTLEIYDSCSSAPGEGQEPTFSPDVRLRFTAPQDGPLYLRVRNSEGAPAGSQATYQLSVRALDATGTPGAVVIVAGKLRDNDDVQSNIHHVTNAVYQLFLDHGYADDRLQYLATEDLDADGDGVWDVDAETNRANLEHAITQWAPSLVSEERAFTLYLMDHGGYDKFYLNGSAETVTPSQIAGWLDTLEQAVPGLKVNVILDACKSGSFIDLTQSLSGPGRVVIASTGARRLAWATQDGAIFSDHFIAALDRGLSLYSSFETAKWAVEAAKPAQTPWLDDNGNGLHNEADDGAVAAVRGFAYAGTFGEGDDEWPPYVVGMGMGEIVEGRGVITAEVRDNGATAPHVWAEIYPPTYTVPSLAAGEEMVVDTAPTVTLIHQGDDLYRVEYDGFSASGDDRVVVYARDENGLLSRPDAIGDPPQPQQRIYLPLVLRNYATPATFPVFIESAIPQRPVNEQDEIFHTTEVRIPDTLPDGGRFYLSSERDRLTEVVVDDRLIIQLHGIEVYSNLFYGSDGVQPEIVELSRTTMERIHGQTITVLYQDVGAGVVAASEMWLIWVPTP